MTQYSVSTDIPTHALDIEGLAETEKGQKLVTALMAQAAKLYRTKRGRLALLVKKRVLAAAEKQFKFTLSEGFDGTKTVTFPLPTPPAPAPALTTGVA